MDIVEIIKNTDGSTLDSKFKTFGSAFGINPRTVKSWYYGDRKIGEFTLKFIKGNLEEVESNK